MRLSLLFICLLSLFACSKSETATSTATRKLNASLSFQNTDTWPERYTICLGAFSSSSSLPLKTVDLQKKADNTTQSIELEIPVNTEKIQVYIANSAKQPITVLFEQSVSAGEKTDLQLSASSIKLTSFARLQEQVFNSCIACHGGSSGSPAAGLNLTTDHSYSNLVGVAAKNSSKKRVLANDTTQSFIVDVLHQKNLSFAHTASLITPQEDINLIKAWILKGATKE